MSTKYQSELLRTVNSESGKTYFYIKKCNEFTRISKEEYNERYDSSDGVSCLFTDIKGKFTRHYTTVTFYLN